MKKHPLSAFTLLELLVVIAVIAILASLVLSIAGMVQTTSARKRAQTEIAGMSAALERYKADNGDYPGFTNTSPTGPNAVLCTNLSPPVGSTNTVYFSFPKYMTNSSNYIIDPFGNSYCYQYPGNANRSGINFFDLYSVANDTAGTNSNAWIKNW